MRTAMDCVANFHDKYEVSGQQVMQTGKDDSLWDAAAEMMAIAERLEKEMAESSDRRILRAHLMVEELAEMLNAMAMGDEVEALDGLTDLLYVTLGTAVTFDWPVPESFAEVHLSNMTKKRKSDDAGRVRDKGDEYKPPKLGELLERHRLVAYRKPPSILGHLEKKWLQEHPRTYDALTPSQQKLIDTSIGKLRDRKSEVFTQARLHEIRDGAVERSERAAS